MSALTRECVTLNYREALAVHIPTQLLRTVHRDLERQIFQRYVVFSMFQKSKTMAERKRMDFCNASTFPSYFGSSLSPTISVNDPVCF